MIYDITRTISPDLAVWPGDVSFSFEQKQYLAKGDSVNLTTLHVSAHTGTHMDAPWHYAQVDVHPADLPLEPYIGRARVVTIERKSGGITPDDLPDGLEGIDRLLTKTWYSDLDDSEWNPDFVHPTPALADWLGEQGVVLFGVDTPSVDASDSKDLPTHRQLHQNDILIVENLMLRDVPDGLYEFIALPLKIADVCGGPVRAILRTIKE